MEQTKNQLEQIDRILQSAIVLQAHEREAFLDGACGNNRSLRMQVECLLAHDEHRKDFLEQPFSAIPPIPLDDRVAATPRVGNLLADRWEIRHIFGGPGSSGMGIVYIVYDHETHEVFAAKTFQDGAIARDSMSVTRFHREATVWINLDHHHNIARARAVRNIEGKPFVFLEYITGGDLSSWISASRLRNDLPQTLRFAVQFCDGMIHAVRKGIKAHRDIKPQNCLITQDRILKITDFGLVKVLDEFLAGETVNDEKGHEIVTGQVTFQTQGRPKLSALATTIVEARANLSQTGVGMGTARYMAPEQFEDAKHVDQRADIYSFGVMLFEMTTGNLPFAGRSLGELWTMHASWPPPPLQSQNAALDSLVETCLSKDPNRRFRDFCAVRNELAQIYEALTQQTAPIPISGKELAAEEWYNKGLSLHNLGHSQLAIDCYDRALELRPDYVAAWNNKATALDLSEAAIDCLDHALALNPGWEASWYNKATALEKLGRTKEAFECYDRVLEINPLNDGAWNDRGAALSELGRIEDAVKSYDRAVEINPRNAKAWFNKANAFRNSGRTQESLDLYDRALQIDPGEKEAWINKGVTLSELGKCQEALDSLDRAIELDGRSKEAWANKGRALRETRRPRRAIECYDQALELAPKDADVWSDKGNAFGDLGETANALECFDRAITFNPRHDKAWYNRANELRKLGRLEDAVAAYDKALESSPALHQASANKGLTLMALGRLDEALTCYDAALQLNQNEAVIWFNRGNTLFQLKRAEEAIQSYDQALKLDPQSAQTWNNKGAALVHGLRNYRGAIMCFEKAAQLGDPNGPAAMKECQRLLAMYG